MRGQKNVVLVVILVAIIVAAVVFFTKGSKLGGVKPPKWVLDRQVERIDSETLELVTKTVDEWQDLGQENGRYKNPKSDTFTMVEPIKCVACGEKIPPPDLPPMPERTEGQSLAEHGEAENAARAQAREILRNHECPQCGERALSEGRIGSWPY